MSETDCSPDEWLPRSLDCPSSCRAALAAEPCWLQEFSPSHDDAKFTRHEIETALALIAEDDKQAFLYALERVPQLVEIETHPIKFLLRENFDVAKAIKRLVLHWKFRCEVFGPDRAFRPMTISGDGALSPEDVSALRTPTMMILQRTGSPALYTNHDLVSQQSPALRKKIHFYHMQLMVRKKLYFRNAGNNLM